MDSRLDRGLRLRVLALALICVAGLAAGCGGSDGGSGDAKTTADGKLDLEGVTISYLGFGGSSDEGMKKAWFEPFEQETGAKVVLDSPTDYKKVETQVKSGNVTYDIVDGDPYIIDPKCGELFEPLDVDLRDVEPQYLPSSRCGVPDYVYGYLIVSSTNKFGAQGGPQNCPDFFDTAKFPGKRAVWSYYVSGIVECAAIAAGADPKDPYRSLDVDKAFAKLESIKDDIVIYDTAAQAVDQLQNEDVAMGIYTPRMVFDAVSAGAPFVEAKEWAARAYGAFAVPKGAPNRAAAEELLKYLIQPEVNQKLSQDYAPAIGSPTGGDPSPKLGEWTRLLPSVEPLASVAMDIDWRWWATNDAAIGQRWNDYATTG